MIQRIQTIYLFMAALATGAFIWSFPVFRLEDSVIFVADDVLLLAGFMTSTLLSILEIFRYSNRKQQIVIGRLNILVNLILLGIMVYRVLNLPGGVEPEKGISFYLPLIAIVCIVLANKAIQRDENRVKSADRLR